MNDFKDITDVVIKELPMYQQQYQTQPNTCDTRYAERSDMYNT